ncbi:hypothetical protein FP2506_01245 [Fulvimarina pelagi HTCC2506]|uniref:Uncharacterized protein n=1 Tax=Fulvimarina pelagi HTCC2506 TaxID=314231 RepID=Q0G248_9HYPH|nr:hypothetical protein FP2506_01245 [Fulvimarina pelagi HTCC2506]
MIFAIRFLATMNQGERTHAVAERFGIAIARAGRRRSKDRFGRFQSFVDERRWPVNQFMLTVFWIAV